jgi:lysophospholipase L1-like esterase
MGESRVSHTPRRITLISTVALLAGLLVAALAITTARAGGARQSVGASARGATVSAVPGGTHVDKVGTQQRGASGRGRVGAWEAAMTAGGPSFSGQTIRMIVHTGAAGSRLRLRLSDLRGSDALAVGAADIAVQSHGADAVPGTRHAVTFSGSPTTTVATGTERFSDPIPMTVAADRNLLVSLFLPRSTGSSTFHREAYDTTYISTDGVDHAADDTGGGYSETTSSWYYLTGLDLVPLTARGTLVAFGDSITDGYHSTAGANRRWPDQLARRLAARPGGQRLGVVDAGIAGNRLLSSAPQIYRGVSGVRRFAHDALGQPGVKDVIVLEGVNDLTNGVDSAQQLIDGYRTVISEAHADGVRVIGATILPYSRLSPAANAIRDQVNQWIRTSHAFDAVADFDRALRDPADPAAMAPAFDSGDHLHPDDAGMLAMARSVPLSTLSSQPS